MALSQLWKLCVAQARAFTCFQSLFSPSILFLSGQCLPLIFNSSHKFTRLNKDWMHQLDMTKKCIVYLFPAHHSLFPWQPAFYNCSFRRRSLVTNNKNRKWIFLHFALHFSLEVSLDTAASQVRHTVVINIIFLPPPRCPIYFPKCCFCLEFSHYWPWVPFKQQKIFLVPGNDFIPLKGLRFPLGA